MTVYDFIDLCIEPGFLKLIIYDGAAEENVYEGYADEMPEKYDDLTVESFDIPTEGSITLNIWTDGC